MTYYFIADKPFRYGKKRYDAGTYKTANIEFLRTSQDFIRIIKERPTIVMDFDEPGAIEIVVEKVEKKEEIKIEIDPVGEVEVVVEEEPEEERVTLDDVQEEIDNFPVEEIVEDPGSSIKDSLPPIEEMEEGKEYNITLEMPISKGEEVTIEEMNALVDTTTPATFDLEEEEEVTDKDVIAPSSLEDEEDEAVIIVPMNEGKTLKELEAVEGFIPEVKEESS